MRCLGFREKRQVLSPDGFARVVFYLVAGRGEATYTQVAAELGLTGEAVKKAVHRMRHRYYALFREAIAQTVADPAEVADEMRYLCAVVAR